MTFEGVDILFEDNHLLVVSKPAGTLAQPDITGDDSLYDWARRYRQVHEGKGENPFVGIVHRLDREVTGVVMLAKTSKSASRLTAQFRDRSTRKIYLAACKLDPNRDPTEQAAAATTSTETESSNQSSPTQVWRDRLSKRRTGTGWQAFVDQPGDDPDAKECVTKWHLLGESGGIVLVRLEPVTGRGHQLRVQCALHLGAILGDERYANEDNPNAGQRNRGTQTRLNESRSSDLQNQIPAGNILLHAYQLAIAHPISKDVMTFIAPLPDHWNCLPMRLLKAIEPTPRPPQGDG